MGWSGWTGWTGWRGRTGWTGWTGWIILIASNCIKLIYSPCIYSEIRFDVKTPLRIHTYLRMYMIENPDRIYNRKRRQCAQRNTSPDSKKSNLNTVKGAIRTSYSYNFSIRNFLYWFLKPLSDSLLLISAGISSHKAFS